MEIVIKNKTITDSFKRSILEEVDKYIDKYMESINVNKNVSSQTIPEIILNEDKEKLMLEVESIRNYLLEYTLNTHRNNVEFSLIL